MLSEQGLVSSHAGQGTVVTYGNAPNQYLPYRRANLLHRSEAFLLEVLKAGYQPHEVEEAVREALDRLRVVQNSSIPGEKTIIRFNGSHDLMVAWMAAHFDQIAPGYVLQLNFTGSLHGLIALENNQAEIAGCHLWDESTDTYNVPFIQKLLPGKQVELITLATRNIGLIVAPGNPLSIQTLEDLAKPGVVFINRQDGSGIRVWLDSMIKKLEIDPENITGYERVVSTHSEVALEVAEKRAYAGIGLQAAAAQYGLDFVPLSRERYDIIFLSSLLDHPALRKLVEWLQSPAAKEEISRLPGYQNERTGISISTS
jgi:putative molybdopterin biosynthesis protein